MKKIVITLLILISTPCLAKDYIFTPSRVIDGDTIEIKERAFGLKLAIRVNGIDTPEKGFRAKCDSENELALKASAFTGDFVHGKNILVSKLKWDKYGGRMLGDIRIGNKNLSQELIDRGLAREYHGEKKKSWCK
jgi:micrococcal nuclease